MNTTNFKGDDCMSNNTCDKKSFKEVVKENKGKIIGATAVVASAGIAYVLYKEIPNLLLLKEVILDGALNDAITTNTNKINYRYSKLATYAGRTDEASLIKKAQYEAELKILLRKDEKYKKLLDSIFIK